MMGHFSDSDVEFDGKYNTNVEFRDSGSADGVSNWNELAPPPSCRPLAGITQCGMVWDGSASMSTCSNSSCSDYRNTHCWSRHYSRSVAHGCL